MWFRKSDIASEVKQRKINLLLHSTHLYKNLPRIFEYGILETAGSLINKLGAEKAARYLHDPVRYEKFGVGLDYLNCSITVPNFELLYRRSKSRWGMEWVHFALNPKLLELEDTLFCPLSAAQERGTHVVSGVEGFQSLFANQIENFDRNGLHSDQPTHPQAEVLIHSSLSIESIHAVHTPNADAAREVERVAEFYTRKVPVGNIPASLRLAKAIAETRIKAATYNNPPKSSFVILTKEGWGN